MSVTIRCFLLVSLLFFASSLEAQLIGVGFDKKQIVDYPSINRVYDTIFAYNENPDTWNQKSGTLRAITPDSLGGWETWFQVFNYTSKTYVDSVHSASDSIRDFTNLKTGGYAIRMRKGSVDTFFRAWIFINKLRFYLVKDDKGFVKEFEYTCSSLDLRAITKNDKKFDENLQYYHSDFSYFNPLTKKPIKLINLISFTWTPNKGEPEVTNKPMVRISDPPAENTTYTVTVRDTFGNTASDKVIYKTINTLADFDIFLDTATYYYNTRDRLNPFVPDTAEADFQSANGDSAKGEAPLHVMLKNKSKNGIRFEWNLILKNVFDSLDMFSAIDSAHYITNDSNERVFHIYRHPYKYQIQLISESPYSCIDTSDLKELEVEDSQMGNGNGDGAFPTAFAPNSAEPRHRFFYFKSNIEAEKPKYDWKSLKSIQLWIFNQWGKEMYHYNGEVYNGWKGWDGKTKWGLEAKQGVYYYIFEAYGWGKFLQSTGDKGSGEQTDGGSDGGSSGGPKYGSNKIIGKGYFYLFRDPSR